MWNEFQVILMNKKMIFIILIIIIIGLFYTYFVSDFAFDDLGESKTLYVSTEGPFNLTELIEDVESEDYYEGYDRQTVDWMKSLGDKSVFPGDGDFAVMDADDASKLHSEYIDDAYITQEFRCVVLENHSLGNVKYSHDIVLVGNVEYVGENMTSLFP